MSKGITFTSTECAWIKSLIKSDIYEWQEQAKRPFNEVGHQFSALMHLRIENMRSLFRHTFATILLEERENPKIVSELMGHSKVLTTLSIYSHVISKSVYESTAKTLDRAVANLAANKKTDEPCDGSSVLIPA